MTTNLNKLIITAALFGFAVTACDKAWVTTEHSGRQVELTQHGDTSCVLVDQKVFCAPARLRAPMRLASTTAI